MQISLGAGSLNEQPQGIDLPDIGELLTMPSFHNIFLDDAYKFASCEQKKLLDQFPVKNDKKYVLATFVVRFLNKNASAYLDPFVPYQKKWHLPTSTDLVSGEEDRYLHLINGSQSTLELSANDQQFDFNPEGSPTTKDFNFWMVRNRIDLDIPVLSLKENTIIQYDGTTLIRNVDARRIEFRLDIRMIETDSYKRFPHNSFQVKLYNYRESSYRNHIDKKPNQLIAISLPDIYANDLTSI